MNSKILKSALAMAFGAAMSGAPPVHAESDTVTVGNATAHLNFSVVIPRFLSFQVGTAGTTVDTITFTVPFASVGAGGAGIAGTGGDVGGGVVTVKVVGNNGQVTITPTNSGGGTGLKEPVSGDTISYAEIVTTSSDAANLDAPVLSDAGGTATTPTINSAKRTNRTAQWTFKYANTTFPSAGTYGATAANGGEVTYTASMP